MFAVGTARTSAQYSRYTRARQTHENLQKGAGPKTTSREYICARRGGHSENFQTNRPIEIGRQESLVMTMAYFKCIFRVVAYFVARRNLRHHHFHWEQVIYSYASTFLESLISLKSSTLHGWFLPSSLSCCSSANDQALSSLLSPPPAVAPTRHAMHLPVRNLTTARGPSLEMTTLL